MEKETINMVEKKRKRSANWDSLEKTLLRTCIKEFVAVIENKNTDTNTNKAKNTAWQKITERFNELNTRDRTLVEVKQQWRTTKLEAKKKLSNYKREQNETGGGQKPQSPDPETNAILEMIPQEFEVDFNKFDSNSIQPKTSYDEDINCAQAAPVEVIHEIVLSPTQNIQNFEEVIVTPLASVKEGKDIENLYVPCKRRILKRKLPFDQNNLAHQRNEVLIKSIEAEHDIKIKQLSESHEWARKEHQLRLKEAELRIQNLELEKLLLTSKINKINSD